MASTLALLFGVRAAVTRREYVTAGVLLFALKYAVDLALSIGFAEHPLGPVAYFNPVLSQRLQALGQYPDALPPVMLAWALPFIWIGVSMSARRAVDAGRSVWWSLVFFVPVLNYLLIAGLSAAPSSDRGALPAELREVSGSRRSGEESALERLRVAAVSAIVAGIFGFLAVSFSVIGVGDYGSALFIGGPFVLGVIAGVLLNRSQRHSITATIAIGALGVTFSGGLMLLTALEGVLCLAMAAIPAYPLAILGALLGRAFAGGRRPEQPTLSMVVAWPVLALLPSAPSERFPVRAAVSAIEIDAPPERVWPNVIGFSPLPPPSEWLMRAGVACPLSARIEGEGVGAVRYCEFTTGPFVEPITTWEPPYRLAFDVTAQPPSMREWSPYEVVHAPHLVGGVESLRGEFRLTRLPGERTRIEGTTWYRLKMAPQPYWGLYSDYAIHVIHQRVLRHIRDLSESQR